MKKSLLSIAVATTLFSNVANADFIGVEFGGTYWNPEMSGDFQYNGTKMDLENNLGYNDEDGSNSFWLSVEHPVPLIPNLKIVRTSLEMDATKTNSTSITFSNQTYSANEAINTSMTLDQTDYILYYELSEGLIIPFVHLDVGIAVKDLEAKTSLSNSSLGTYKKEFNAYVPMVYGKIKLSTSSLPIPFIPDIEYETLRLSIGDNEIDDTKIGIVYDVELAAGFNVGASAGYRKESLEIDESGVKANIDIEGYYFGAYFNW